MLHLLQEVDALFLCFDLLLPNEVLSSLANCIHEVWFQKIVVLVKLKTLMKELGINLSCQSHKTNCLILYLGDKGLVVFGLSCNEFSQEILSVSLSNSFRLIVKHICQVIMVLLLGSSHFDEGQHQHPRGKGNSRCWSNASDVLKDLWILAFDLFEEDCDRIEAIINIIIVCVTSCKEEDTDNVWY